MSRTSYRTACHPSGEKTWPSWKGTSMVSVRAAVDLEAAFSMSTRPCQAKGVSHVASEDRLLEQAFPAADMDVSRQYEQI